MRENLRTFNQKGIRSFYVLQYTLKVTSVKQFLNNKTQQVVWKQKKVKLLQVKKLDCITDKKEREKEIERK